MIITLPLSYQNSMKFSVIILSYNSELKNILMTIKSIILQEEIGQVQIVVADDGSKQKWDSEIKVYLKKQGFANFIIVPGEENVGTVKNILRALPYAKGKYIKLIGAGDLLYNANVLEKVYSYMEDQQAKFVFGELQGYSIANGIIKADVFSAPWNKKPYIKRKHNMIAENMIFFGDFISGASMFFEKNFFEKEIKNIENVVIYVEDIMQVIMCLGKRTFNYIPEELILYEVGSGISTSSKNGDSRMKKDEERFWEYVNVQYADNYWIKKRNRLNKYTKFILRLTKTPVAYLKYKKWKLWDRFHQKPVKESAGFLTDAGFMDEFIKECIYEN